MKRNYEQLGQRVGALVDVKNAAYGSAFDDAGDFLRILYPQGIQPDQYGDALALVRIFDKMKRIATDKDALGESPYQDIAGYGLLGLRRVEDSKAERQRASVETLPTIPPAPLKPNFDFNPKSEIAKEIIRKSSEAPPPAGELIFSKKRKK
jgi:hypothetical protein